MWVTPLTEWDGYVVSLGYRALTIQNKALAKEAKEFTYIDLLPGQKYTATVTTISGDLNNWTSVVGRTGNELLAYYEPHVSSKSRQHTASLELNTTFECISFFKKIKVVPIQS